MINLGGSVFHIEEDAYQALKNYLDTIKANFSGDSGQQEIMQDIESRIAELFRDLLGEGRSVVQTPEVNQVMAVMGKPEDYGGSEAPPAGASYVRNRMRRIYRDTDDAEVGGVCSGLSHYLGWDPLILRVAAVVLLLLSAGTVLLVYLILWAVVPAAETTAEKLQMAGEPVNIENIRKKVNDDARMASEKIKSSAGRFAQKAERGGRNAAKAVGNVVSKVLGVFMLIFGLMLLFVILGALVTADFGPLSSWEVSFSQLDTYWFGTPGTAGWLLTGILLVMAAPCISLIYAGIKLLFGIRTKIPGLGWGLTLLFLCGIGILLWKGASVANAYEESARLKETYPFDTDTLFVAVNNDPYFHNSIESDDREFFDMIRKENGRTLFGEPVNLHFHHAESDQFRLDITAIARGESMSRAITNAEQVEYGFTLSGDSIFLDPFMALPEGATYRAHEVEIDLYIPGGKTVRFGDNIHRINWHDRFNNSDQTMKKNGKWQRWSEEDDEFGSETTEINVGPGSIRITTREESRQASDTTRVDTSE